MQTFLPYDNYEQSVESLDDARLRKQCVEVGQILDAIIYKTGWKNHPVSKMFKNHTNSLVTYGLYACVEAKMRGFKWEKNYDKTVGFYNHQNCDDMPEWVGDQELHDSHKARLLEKGLFDVVCGRIKKHFKIKSFNKWLKQNIKLEKNQLRVEHLPYFQNIINENNIPDYGMVNFYEQFKWQVKIGTPYKWPIV